LAGECVFPDQNVVPNSHVILISEQRFEHGRPIEELITMLDMVFFLGWLPACRGATVHLMSKLAQFIQLLANSRSMSIIAAAARDQALWFFHW